jgi:[acyl-carrier-protein] S-malonyltransferase
MKAFVFPGQASQFEGMGKDMYESSDLAKEMFDRANEVLGFDITKVMFEGTAEELKETKITQPAVFLHSVIKAKLAGADFKPDMVAGHSLGELSALVAVNALSFDDGLKLVQKRANAMQKACEAEESTMAAIVGLEDQQVEDICNEVTEVVVAANFNCPGQVVISGSIEGVNKACEKLKEAGAKRAIVLQVGGAFHSPLMLPAQEELGKAIDETDFSAPACPIYQNVTAKATTDIEEIKLNLKKQLTGSVRWTDTMKQMIADGASEYIEVGGTGKVLRGFIMRIDRRFPNSAL